MGLPRSDAIEHLPDTYRRIIRWLDSNVTEDDIALRLDLEPESVRALVIVAQAKLERLLGKSCAMAEPEH